jgi:type IV pilus assembly protein PilA
MQYTTAGGFGFPVIQASIVLGVIGILAAVALPAYRDYTIRNRVKELIHAAATCREAVNDFYQARGVFPVSAAQVGCAERVTSNANPLAVFRGEVIVQAVGPLAAQLGSRNIFAMRAVCVDGACQGERIIEWSCSASRTPAASTTILPKYLPQACR